MVDSNESRIINPFNRNGWPSTITCPYFLCAHSHHSNEQLEKQQGGGIDRLQFDEIFIFINIVVQTSLYISQLILHALN